MINEMIMEFACKFAGEINAKAILLYSEVVQDIKLGKDNKVNCDIILISREDGKVPKNIKHSGKVIYIPDINFTLMSQVKIAINKGI